MSELTKMYPAQAKSTEISLSGALTATDTTINVVDGSALPDAPNLLTIGADGSTAETVLMTAKSGNTITVIRAQDGTAARAWSAGDVIARYFTAEDQNVIQENIKKLNKDKAEKVASPVAGNLAGLDANGNPTDSGTKPDDFANASHTHADKADKVKSATEGNLAALDSSGNLADSGKKPDDFADANHTHDDIPTALSELTEDATHRLVTDTEKTTWNGKQSKITASGILKGNGSGGVSAATAGTDYAAPSRSAVATLTAAGWSDGVQTVSVSAVTSSSNGSLRIAQDATDEQFAAWCAAQPRVTAQATNTITIKAAGTVPTIDIPVEVLIV